MFCVSFPIKLLSQNLKAFHFRKVGQLNNMSSTCGVYVHWPYCRQKCSFCNFNKYVSDDVDHHRMTKCLMKEARMIAERSDTKQACSIFFGGGTPSLMKISNIEAVIDAIKKIYNCPDNVEVSLEANPEDLVGRVKDFAEAGINRISLGVQGLNDEELKLLNRSHNVEQGLDALAESLHHLPNSTSADLMFGRPGQSLDAWLREMDVVLATGVSHLSLYQLTVEHGTKLEKQVKSGMVVLPNEDEVVDMYCQGVDFIEGSGLRRYEVSNFAVGGRECIHNQLYWTGGQYVGIGPGAHGRLVVDGVRQAWVNLPLPGRWMGAVEREGTGGGSVKCQDTGEALKELLATGLRTRMGVDKKDWDRLAGGRIAMERFVEGLVGGGEKQGLIWDGDRLNLDHGKINVVDNIVPYLFNHLDNRLSA